MTPKGQDINPILVVRDGLNIDYTSIILRLGFALVKNLRTHINGIADENGSQMLDAFVIKICDGFTANIRDSNTNCERKNESPNHKNLPMLIMARIIRISMNRVVVHRQKTEKVVIAFKDGFR